MGYRNGTSGLLVTVVSLLESTRLFSKEAVPFVFPIEASDGHCSASLSYLFNYSHSMMTGSDVTGHCKFGC